MMKLNGSNSGVHFRSHHEVNQRIKPHFLLNGRFELHEVNISDIIANLTEGTDTELLLGIRAMPFEISACILVYLFLFVVGFFGNLAVIVQILRKFRTNQKMIRLYGKGTSVPLQNYVLTLATVDLFVTVMIPMLIPYLFYGQWLIGELMCKLFWIVDQVNKVLSVHILTGMAIERYLIVRASVDSRRGPAPRKVTLAFFGTTLLSVLLLSPLFVRVQINGSDMHGKWVTTFVSFNSFIPGSCVSPIDDDTLTEVIVGYNLLLSYGLPVVIVCFCYVNLVRLLRKRYKMTQMTENSKTKLVHKVTKSILYVTAFHFACWTPYWVVTLVPLLDKWFSIFNLQQHDAAWMRVQICVLILPYVNCSFNWCFYVLLNQRLRRQIFRADLQSEQFIQTIFYAFSAVGPIQESCSFMIC